MIEWIADRAVPLLYLAGSLCFVAGSLLSLVNFKSGGN